MGQGWGAEGGVNKGWGKRAEDGNLEEEEEKVSGVGIL